MTATDIISTMQVKYAHLFFFFFFSVPRFSIRWKKNSQKLNVFFLVKNHKNYRLYGIVEQCRNIY